MPPHQLPPASVEDLRRRIAALGLDTVGDSIVGIARPSVRLVPGGPDDTSFFGEPEQFPAGFVRPTLDEEPLSTVLCLDLRALAGFAKPALIPSTGWLMLFAAFGVPLMDGGGRPDNDGAAAVRVLDAALLQPQAGPFAGEFQRVGLRAMLTLPDPDIVSNYLNMPADLQRAYEALREPQASMTPAPPSHALHYLFGYPSWLYSAAPADPTPEDGLLLQAQLHEALGIETLGRPQLDFIASAPPSLDTVQVEVQT